MLRVGLSSFTYSWEVGLSTHPHPNRLSATGLVERASELGVGVVQIADNLPLHELSRPDLEQLSELARSLEVSIEVGTRGIGDKNLDQYLDIAEIVGSPIVRVVVDNRTDQPTPSEVIERLRPHATKFTDRKVRLAIENHDRFLVEHLVKIVTQLGDWTGICLDTVNSFAALEPPAMVIEALAPHAINLHIKDFAVVRADHHMGFSIEGRPVGGGQLEVAQLLRTVTTHGDVASGIIELWTPPNDDVVETIRTESAWALESLTYLRDVHGLA